MWYARRRAPPHISTTCGHGRRASINLRVRKAHRTCRRPRRRAVAGARRFARTAAAREPSELRGRPAGRSAVPAPSARACTARQRACSPASDNSSAVRQFTSAEHHGAVGEAERQIHVLLRQRQRGAVPPRAGERIEHLVDRHRPDASAGPSSIQHQEGRFGRQGAAASRGMGDGRSLPPRRPHGRRRRWRGPPREPNRTCGGGHAGLGPPTTRRRATSVGPTMEARGGSAAAPRQAFDRPAHTPRASGDSAGGARRTSVGGGRRS